MSAHSYQILGLPNSASTTDVKKAYKKLARLYHPDKSTQANAAEKMKEVNRAYHNILDPNNNQYLSPEAEFVAPPRRASPPRPSPRPSPRPRPNPSNLNPNASSWGPRAHAHTSASAHTSAHDANVPKISIVKQRRDVANYVDSLDQQNLSQSEKHDLLIKFIEAQRAEWQKSKRDARGMRSRKSIGKKTLGKKTLKKTYKRR